MTSEKQSSPERKSLDRFRFDRMELAGSLGDLGTIIPLAVSLMIITGLRATTVLLMVGLFYICSGLYFRLPVPVQPLKVVAAVAIAFPGKITPEVMAAAGISFGVILLLLAVTGLIDFLARFFSRPIIRGIQLGVGLILLKKGIALIASNHLFIGTTDTVWSVMGIPANPILGITAGFFALLLLTNRRFPAALALVFFGIVIGLSAGALNGTDIRFGPTPVTVFMPSSSEFVTALLLLVIPQIPLTLGNAVIGTADACHSLFGKEQCGRRINYRAFAVSMGSMNLVTGFLGGMPMCHGAGGLAAHYRFGARTGGSNLMIGGVFLALALVAGKFGAVLLSAIPGGILGVLLVFAGLELSMLIRDVSEKNDWFVVILIAGIGLFTTHMEIAFGVGMLVQFLIRKADLTL